MNKEQQKQKTQQITKHCQQRIHQLDPATLDSLSQLTSCYDQLIQLNKDKPKQVLLLLELLQKIQKLTPYSSQVIELHERIGDLLWENSKLTVAIEFYKAVFNMSKIKGILQHVEVGVEKLVELGKYFLEEGYILGRQFYEMAIQRVREQGESQKEEEIQKLLQDVDRNRSKVFEKLTERVQKGCFVKPISEPSKLLNNLKIQRKSPWMQTDALTRLKLQTIQKALKQIQSKLTQVQQI